MSKWPLVTADIYSDMTLVFHYLKKKKFAAKERFKAKEAGISKEKLESLLNEIELPLDSKKTFSKEEFNKKMRVAHHYFLSMCHIRKRVGLVILPNCGGVLEEFDGENEPWKLIFWKHEKLDHPLIFAWCESVYARVKHEKVWPSMATPEQEAQVYKLNGRTIDAKLYESDKLAYSVRLWGDIKTYVNKWSEDYILLQGVAHISTYAKTHAKSSVVHINANKIHHDFLKKTDHVQLSWFAKRYLCGWWQRVMQFDLLERHVNGTACLLYKRADL